MGRPSIPTLVRLARRANRQGLILRDIAGRYVQDGTSHTDACRASENMFQCARDLMRDARTVKQSETLTSKGTI